MYNILLIILLNIAGVHAVSGADTKNQPTVRSKTLYILASHKYVCVCASVIMSCSSIKL